MDDLITGGVATPESAVTPVPAVAPVEPKPDPLAKIIAAQREERQARIAKESETKDLRSKYEALQAEHDNLKKSAAFEDDPVAYGKARGWSAETQAQIGQFLLYDLVPDKAPSDLRIRLFEMKQARKEAEAAKTQSEAQRQAAIEDNKARLAEYGEILKNSIPTFEEGSAPESEAYYGDDLDTYQRSLMATAMNMSNVSKQTGQPVDLSPANVRRVLEAEVMKRMSARDARVAARKPKQAAPGVPAVGKQAPVETESSRGLSGNGAPIQPAASEAERVQRAIEALVRKK